MTDQPNPSADRAANPPPPDGEAPSGDSELAAVAGDPELAALVGGDVPADGADPSTEADAPAPAVAGDPELAALVGGGDAPAAEEEATTTDEPALSEAPVGDALATVEPAESATSADTASPDPEPGADDPTLVLPIAAAVTDGEPPARPRRRRSLAFRFGVAFAIGFVLAIGLGAGGLYAWSQQYEGRVLPGVRVGSTDLGGLTRDQAETKIAAAYGTLTNGQITLTGPDGQLTTISYAEVGRGPKTAAVLDAAFAAGREGEPIANLISAPQAAIHGVSIDSAVAYDHDKLAAIVDSLATAIDETPMDAYVSSGEFGTFNVSPARDGRAVDKAALLSALDQQLAALDAPASIALGVPVVSQAPAVATTAADAAKAAADRMTADLIVARGEDTWTITGTSLAPLVSFTTAADGTITPVFDQSGLDPIVKTLAKDVNQTVRNAGLKLVSGHVVATDSSREGRTLNADGMKAALLAEIGSRQGGALATPVTAVVKAVAPKLTTADAKAYASKMKMISSYSVFYWVIVNNHWGGNIEAPATKINGTVVPAGSTFDFWKVVGDLHDLPGAGPGNAIEGGKITVTGAFGGGICTTSTTLFNAAFHAGMVPIARKNHNEFIDRYPPGLDATVWIVGNTKQTMSFKNDTKYPILISRTITHAGSKRWLTFKIWSVPNGRTAKVSNLVIKPGKRAIDQVVDDPTKPVGYGFRNNSPVNGAKVWVTVTIYDHGKVHWSKRYFSNYPAVNGVFIRGTRGA